MTVTRTLGALNSSFLMQMRLMDIKLKSERECYDENVFLKADRALNK